MKKILIFDEKTIKENPYTSFAVSKVCSLHKHTFFEFSICASGVYENIINGNRLQIHQGSIMLLRPNDIHFFVAPQPHVARDVYVDCKLMKTICDLISPELYDKLYSKPLLINYTVNNRILQNIIIDLDLLYEAQKTNTLTLHAQHINIITNLLSLWLKSTNEEKGIPDWLSLLVTQINTGSFVTMRVDEVVATTNYSHSYVCKCFQKYYGKSLATFLNNAKFSHSLLLLADDSYTINEISDALNYSSPTNFTLAFKNKFGISPTEWKHRQLIK